MSSHGELLSRLKFEFEVVLCSLMDYNGLNMCVTLLARLDCVGCIAIPFDSCSLFTLYKVCTACIYLL